MHISPIVIVLIIASVAGLWKIFEKAGEKGWKAIVPVYGFYVWLKILKKPWWWLIIFLIPGVGFMMTMVMSGLTSIAFQKKKASDMLLGGIFFFVYLPALGFGKAKFQLPEKDKKAKRSASSEWLEAITFAVVAATIIRTFFIEAYTIPTSSMEKSLMIGDYLFVSKIDYGARIPMTPISFPFAHNTLPLTKHTNSYLEWLEYPYFRLPGFTHIKRHDVVVFNFPEGDTVPTNIDNPSYYALCRRYSRNYVLSNQPIEDWGVPGPLIVRPIDKEENYIKRCIGVPGDTLLIRHSQVYINGTADPIPSEAQFKYAVTFNGNINLYNIRRVSNGYQADIACNNMTVIDKNLLEKLDITEPIEVIAIDNQIAELDIDNKYRDQKKLNTLLFTLPKENVEKFKHLQGVASVTPFLQDSGIFDPSIFPFSPDYRWNVDNFGPLYIPKEGATIKLDTTNIHIYRRLITAYEHNDLKVEGATIYINGKPTNSYTFKMNYYFMMGDNRHNSEDSRYWGFVPEDHVVGKASFIWMSLKENVPFSKKFRMRRFFTFIGSEGLSPSYFLPSIIVIVIALLYFYIRGRRRANS